MFQICVRTLETPAGMCSANFRLVGSQSESTLVICLLMFRQTGMGECPVNPECLGTCGTC
jgi:hypothetical protein